MPHPTLVYLVRHAVTEWNLQKRFQGQLDVPLSTEGIEQAEAVAGWLAEQPTDFTTVYSSDLARALQTAQTIGTRLQLEPQPSIDLREINCGLWQGLSVEEVEEQYPGQLNEWRERVDMFRLPGGESIPDVQKRMFDFYNRTVLKHNSEAIVIVSHGAALSALQTAIYGWDLQETWNTRLARMGNTGVTVLSIDFQTGKTTSLVRNSMGHLARPTGMSSVLDPAV